MEFIRKIINLHQTKIQERNAACSRLLSKIDEALIDANRIFSSAQSFIDPQTVDLWNDRHCPLLEDPELQNIHPLRKAAQYQLLESKRYDLYITAQSLLSKVLQHNEQIAHTKTSEAYALIGDVEGHKLDPQQMRCIVKDTHNHLVVAGAGTGKTTTIIGKIKYLLASGKYLPQDILVLSFTNASAAEMSKRIAAETGCTISASTFHKLGLNIIAQTDGVVPKITQLNLRKFIRDQLRLNMQSESYLALLSSYLFYHHITAKSEFEFTTLAEYQEYLKLNPPTTVTGETVKSYGEMDIANFLTQNNVRYIYEHPYKVDTRTSQYGQYHPDFYLPDYDIYIEYFGISRTGEVPSYFAPSHGMTATEAYRTSIEWKRALHRKQQTTLIECYAYEKTEETLLASLKAKLEAAAVVLTPKTPQELWDHISSSNATPLEGLIELFETLINLIKSDRHSIASVRDLICTASNAQANNCLLALLEPIFNAYCQHLAVHNEIDFNDMINLASDYVQQGRYPNPYKYVIVDECQDISKARYHLLASLRQSNDYGLFCVGDDWQSIYRFAGSDIGFILNFSQYWGASEVSKIETTYRFSQRLIEISGNFIMQNPLQIEKDLCGRVQTVGFPLGEIAGYTEPLAVEFLAKRLHDLPRDSSVFFLGRYSFDINPIANSESFSCRHNNTSGFTEVTFAPRPDLQIHFLTAHKAKGLQADYVFILNTKRLRMGFPSKIQDAPILGLLLENCDQYPHAEERRLFYVAMTRAKQKVFLVTIRGNESEFVTELKTRYHDELKREPFECPRCGGHLVKRSGPYGEFWGCSNYHSIGCKYKRNLH